jgi:hypothetical protein
MVSVARHRFADFDYHSLPAPVASFLRGQAERIRRGYTNSIIQIGKALIEAKRHLSHGAFADWLHAEIGVPVRTAQAYMQVAFWTKGKSETLTHLPPTMLYLLSARSTPAEFSEDLVRRLEAGEHVDIAAARSELKKLKSRSQARKSRTHLHCDAPSIAEIERLPSVQDAVAILSRELSLEDFARVHDIFTCDEVLADPNLASNIRKAFSGLPKTTLDYTGNRPRISVTA